jgi:hypothetical protein
MATKINKEQLGPLAISDDDVSSISLSKLAQSGATNGQIAAWNEAQGEWIPISIPDGMVFVENETPIGTIDNINTIFLLSDVPSPPQSLMLYRGGVLMKQGPGYDYTLTDNEITFEEPPQVNDILVAYYRT